MFEISDAETELSVRYCPGNSFNDKGGKWVPLDRGLGPIFESTRPKFLQTPGLGENGGCVLHSHVKGIICRMMPLCSPIYG